MLVGFAVMFSESVLPSVPRPTVRLSLQGHHCVTTVSLLRSVALHNVQSDMYIATVTVPNDVIHNTPIIKMKRSCNV
jgi:hypothetical protein